MDEIIKRLGPKDKIIPELLNVYKKQTIIEIKNEFKKLKQKYAINVRLNRLGIQRAEKLIEKYWMGKRMVDDEFILALSIIPMYYYSELCQSGAGEIIKSIYSEAEKRFGVNWQDHINPTNVRVYYNENLLFEEKYLFLFTWSIKAVVSEK